MRAFHLVVNDNTYELKARNFVGGGVHRRPPGGGCVAKRAGAVVSGPCGATLVVCPAPILPQWRSELARHAAPGAVKVVVYEV